MPSNSHNTISRSLQCYPCSSIWLSSKPWNNRTSRITSEIRTTFEHREYCSAIFLDVSQAFDRVWLDGKIKTHLPDYTHKLLESYLYNRTFAVRCNTTKTDDFIIKAGVSQGSALGPTLFPLYTADIPTNEQLTTSTFADDTAILSRSRCPGRSTTQLANHLPAVEIATSLIGGLK